MSTLFTPPGLVILAVAWAMPAFPQTNVFTVDSSGNVTATASVSAQAGVGGGTYTSGITATGSIHQTCYLSISDTGTGATASVELTGTDTIAADTPLTIMSTGSGYTTPPTAAAVMAGGSASCSGSSVTISTYLNGVINLLATSKPGDPPSGNGSIWFDLGTDWPMPVPMGLDASGNYTSSMVRMNEASSTGPYYWGVGGALPTATWMIYDNSTGGSTSEVIQAGASQSGNIWTVKNNSGTSLWAVTSAGNLAGGAGGSFILAGSSSGSVSVQPPGSFSNYNFNLPSGAGTSGQVLASGGGGTNPMTWTSGVVLNTQVNTYTNQSAPSTPSTGSVSVWTDSTDKNLKAKNDAGTVSVTVQPASAVSHQWVSAISSAGAVTQSQPAATDLSDSASALLTIIAGSGQSDMYIANGTSYYGVGIASSATTENLRVIRSPSACALRNLRFITTATNGGGSDIAVTVRVGNTDTNITQTIVSGDTARGYSDVSHTASVSANDEIDLKMVNPGTASSKLGGWSIGCYAN